MFLVLILVAQVQGILREPPVPKLIIISYSGFRYDYFAHNATPFLNALREDWGDVRYPKYDFFKRKNSHSVTATKEYSTGTRESLENDGFYEQDEQLNKSIHIPTYAQDALPIWIINEINGRNRSSGLMMWPGGDFVFNGTRATYVMEFNENENWNSRIDMVVSWFKDPNRPINLAMLYFEGPNLHTHGVHLNFSLVDDSLRRLDTATEYLYDQLVKNNLNDVNVIHVSDRMMIDISAVRVINITAIIGNEHYGIAGSSSTWIIRPDEDNAVRIYGKLRAFMERSPGFEVYWKAELPNSQLRQRIEVEGIVLIAKPGYIFEKAVTNYEILKTTVDINSITFQQFNSIINSALQALSFS
uniref:Enpp5_2 protein n=1 Tax=Fopius arisanus TaxID=64838 RepID=A0A0C9RCT1_9HYME